MKQIINIIKKIILSALFIYAYNVLAVSFNATIPINIWTIFLVSILGLPSMFGLILFSVVIF